MPNWPAILPIIFLASKKRSTSWLTSETCTPEPLAMRLRREALRILGFSRSAGVMPRMMAWMRSSCFSSTMSAIWSICLPPGSILSRLPRGPILRIISICSRKSSRVSSPVPIFCAVFWAVCSSTMPSACSMSVSTSPMPRMRLAMRSGWKTSKSSSFSPVEANMTGLPVTSRIDRAAPPRASPSSLVSTTPVKSTPSRKASAVVTASWPIIASMTKRTSSGSTASRMSRACVIRVSSMPRRPAVSTMTTSCWVRRASSTPARATATGSPWETVPEWASSSLADSSVAPGSGAKVGTPARSPTICSCWTAPGRCRSQATSIGVWPCLARWRASLPARVVLPAPCRPASMITVGGRLARFSRRVSPPRMSVSSSLTILMTCWAGLRACETSEPAARSLMRLMKPRTTGSETSASRRARRISRAVALMSASVSLPLPRMPLSAPARRSDSDSNTCGYAPSWSWLLKRIAYPW